jgi:hypothetical protein
MATWTEKRKMYMTAYLIYIDHGARAMPCGAAVVQSTRSSGMEMISWAIDVRDCAADERNLSMLDDYYHSGGSGYRRVPRRLTPILRLFWANMRKRNLIGRGEQIVNMVYEDGYGFS